jgi:ribosome-binding protein aMBF1 (putative translation factor)
MHEDIEQRISRRLSEAIEQRGWSAAYVARVSRPKLAVDTVRRLLRGDTHARFDHLIALCTTLGVDLVTIISEEEPALKAMQQAAPPDLRELVRAEIAAVFLGDKPTLPQPPKKGDVDLHTKMRLPRRTG